jgi:hypothetical protein
MYGEHSDVNIGGFLSGAAFRPENRTLPNYKSVSCFHPIHSKILFLYATPSSLSSQSQLVLSFLIVFLLLFIPFWLKTSPLFSKIINRNLCTNQVFNIPASLLGYAPGTS